MLLTVFIDALTPESLTAMPFVSSVAPYSARLRTVLGYSLTCNATMWSGVFPDKHLRWFIWERNPQKSMYGWARPIARHPFETTMVPAYFIYRAQRLFDKRNKSYFGVKYISGSPFRYWPELSMTEEAQFCEPGYLNTYPSVFDLVRKHRSAFEVYGLIYYQERSTLEKIQNTDLPAEFPAWVHLLFGDIDRLTHLYGPHSKQVQTALQNIDREIERFYSAMSKADKDLQFFLWSDHGQAAVTEALDLKDLFRRHGKRLETYLHHLDNNYARFWLRSDEERRVVLNILNSIEAPGYLLSDEISHKYHVTMPDNRYGELIYYLDLPFCFKRPWNPLNLKTAIYPYHHGFSPDHPAMDGVVASPRQLRLTYEDTHVQLTDIMPTILEALHLPLPDYCEGVPLWSTQPTA